MGQFQPFLAYEASAGSGKTFNLVVRYLSLLFMGEDAGAITALTFTNKAANEMRERVIETLQHLEHRGELAEISNVSGLSTSEILDMRSRVLSQLLRAEMKISTIDTFFGTILRKFALNAGIMPTFTPSSEHHDVKFLKRFLYEVEASNAMDSLIHLAQLSSKRLNDIFALLSSLYTKHKELVTFEEQQPFLEESSPHKAMMIASSLSAMMLEKPLSDRSRKTMVIADYNDLLGKTWLYKPTLEYWDFRKVFEPRMDDLLHELQHEIAFCMRTHEATFLKELMKVLKLYIKSRQALISHSNELTFDDITLMVHDLLRGKLDSEFLYFRLDGKMKHLLLDEFQDTSVIQFDILRPLIEEIASGVGLSEGGSFFFVGDVKQSIYRFRGGVSALFYQVAHHFDVQVRALEVNYRSKSVVVEFVNQVFSNVMKNYIRQESIESKRGGYVEVIVDDEPLQRLLEQIHELLEGGVSAEEIAVLCVTNSDASRVQELLEENALSVVSEATSLLIHQRSVRVIIEYLRYCYFGADIYAHNCASLLGCAPEEIEKSIVYDVRKSVVDFARKHRLGDKALLLFIEKLSSYPDIEAVVFEIDRLQATSAQSDLKGIRIMTVHKSKGLEFEHVIVLDRLGQMKSRNETLLYEYDGITLQRLYLRTANRETLDPQYAQALEKERAFEQEDQLNALYVALTRAVQSLRVISKTKSSWFEPLSLSPLQQGEKRYVSHGTTHEPQLKRFEYVAESYGKQEEFLSDTVDELQNIEAVQYGLALHYALEMMDSFDEYSIVLSIEAMRKRFGVAIGDESCFKIEKSLRTLISHPEFYDLTRGKLYKEQRFRINAQMRIIDLLVEHDEGHWVIIDYKSGVEFEREHEAQVREYIQGVRDLTRGEVVGYLCYLSEDKVLIKNLI